jgi:hypothetical protein
LKNLHYDDLDIEFIMGVFNHLECYFQGNAKEVLLASSFLNRLKENPDYVYHYDEHYWANFIRNEYESNRNLVIT